MCPDYSDDAEKIFSEIADTEALAEIGNQILSRSGEEYSTIYQICYAGRETESAHEAMENAFFRVYGKRKLSEHNNG